MSARVQGEGWRGSEGMAGGSGAPFCYTTLQAPSSHVLLPLPALQEPFPLFPPPLRMPSHSSFILVTILCGAFLDHMFYPLSPAKQPYYINLLSFPVT